MDDFFPSTGTNLTEEETAKVRALLQAYSIHNHDGRNSLEVSTKRILQSVQSEQVVFPSDFIAGEALLNGDCVRTALSGELLVSQVVGSSTFNTYGTGNNVIRIAQSFKLGGASTTCIITIKASSDLGGGGRTFTGRIHSDSSNAPGTILYTKTLAVTSGTAERTFDFGAVALTGGTTYWFSVCSDGFGTGSDASVYYEASSLYIYGLGETSTDSGASWAALGGDLYMKISVTEDATGGKLFKASAYSQSQCDKLVGIVTENIATGETVNGVFSGTKRDYDSTLVSGSRYYLSDVSGNISTSPGTFSKEIGKALTSKVLNVNI